jgi:eukaryotic-like serine/threonine-protein kinase
VSVPTSGAGAASGSVGTSQLGRYELVCEIAKAQIGALWAGAADGEAVFVRRVALGTPLPAALHERLSDAARWAASARLPGFAPVLDVIATGDEIGVVSEFRDGECLRALLRQASFKRTPLPLGVALRIAIDVIDALEATEGLDRITPASLWPDSVLVGSDGVTSLLDLGVASVVASDPAWSAHPELASYSAPEKLEDAASASTRSDVFVVGILLWEMIANQRLFTGLSAPAARQKVLTAPLSRLDASKVGAPAGTGLADIVERALNRNPTVRFFDVSELRAALESEFSDTIASPEEVGTALTQISGSLMSIRRRAIDKVLNGGSQHVTAALPAETVEKLRGIAANATLLGVAPLASGSAPSPSSPTNKPVRSGTLVGFPSPDLAKADESPSAFPKRPPAPPPPPRALRPTGVQREDSVDDLLAPLAGLEPERDELDSLDDVLDEVKPLPKPPPPPPPQPRPMSVTAPLGTMSDSVAPDSVDALIASAKGPAYPAPPPPSAPPFAQTAPLGTDVMAQFGAIGAAPPLPPVPSSFPPPPVSPVAQPPSDPPPGARPISMALQRNRKIVIGVVAAMGLLLTVAIVIGAVRSKSNAKDDAAAEARAAKAKTAKNEAKDKPAKAAEAPAKQARSVPAAPKKAAPPPKDEEPASAGKDEAKPAKGGAASTLAAAQTKARAAAQVPKGGMKKPAAKPKPAPKKPVAKAAKKPAPKAKPKPTPKKAKAAKPAKAPAKKKAPAKPAKKVAAKK